MLCYTWDVLLHIGELNLKVNIMRKSFTLCRSRDYMVAHILIEYPQVIEDHVALKKNYEAMRNRLEHANPNAILPKKYRTARTIDRSCS